MRELDDQPDYRYEPYEAPEAGTLPNPVSTAAGERGYEPVHPRWGLRDVAEKILAPLAVVGGLLLKFGGSLKFLGLFASVGGYALLWGWTFAVGLVALIMVHELGHYIEARRQGMHPALPVFIPFLGAYVALKDAPFDPWRNARVTLAGPVLGGIGALALLVAGESTDSRMLLALAYTGFFLNLFNLIPIGFLDGGRLLDSWRVLRRGGGAASFAQARSLSWAVAVMSVATAVGLVLGMVAAHVPQDRL